MDVESNLHFPVFFILLHFECRIMVKLLLFVLKIVFLFLFFPFLFLGLNKAVDFSLSPFLLD